MHAHGTDRRHGVTATSLVFTVITDPNTGSDSRHHSIWCRARKTRTGCSRGHWRTLHRRPGHRTVSPPSPVWRRRDPHGSCSDSWRHNTLGRTRSSHTCCSNDRRHTRSRRLASRTAARRTAPGPPQPPRGRQGQAPSEQGPSQLGLLLQSCISVNFQPSWLAIRLWWWLCGRDVLYRAWEPQVCLQW